MHAVIAQYNRKYPMYIVSIEGMSLGPKDHPIAFELDEDHFGSPFNDRMFREKIKEMIGGLR